MAKVEQLVDAHGNAVPEMRPREGGDLDVGFGGDLNNLVEKLVVAKQIMSIAEQKHPYKVRGKEQTGTLRNLDEEEKQYNTRSLKETITETPKINKTVQPARRQQPVQENDEEDVIYYNRKENTEEDEYDIREAPSLTQELMMATKQQGSSKTVPDFSQPVHEEMIRKSNLPDAIKESFLKNPIQPPSGLAAIGGAQMDAITEKFHQIQGETVKKQPKQQMKQVIKENQTPESETKRDKIKRQLRPIVQELMDEYFQKKFGK